MLGDREDEGLHEVAAELVRAIAHGVRGDLNNEVLFCADIALSVVGILRSDLNAFGGSEHNVPLLLGCLCDGDLTALVGREALEVLDGYLIVDEGFNGPRAVKGRQGLDCLYHRDGARIAQSVDLHFVCHIKILVSRSNDNENN